jgi:hypothetical protein
MNRLAYLATLEKLARRKGHKNVEDFLVTIVDSRRQHTS